ncbi:class I SAM-dependent methyltransferase [Runella sp.]|uniref:class I SAM-dependent methyltransferase n=1 Tax=Runella sp. TaxID=1960881 RepID=UPI003D151E20
MKIIDNTLGKKYLLMWRTESIFYNQQRRKLSEEWNMVRFTSLPFPSEPNLINSSLVKKLPYLNNSFDAIYSFHVFEHLSYDEGLFALKEMYRVMKPGAVCRISTPDLLFFSKEYIKQFELYLANPEDKLQSFRYYWASFNVIDQAVRKKSGGRMVEALKAFNIDRDYLKFVNGDSLNFLLDAGHHDQMPDSARKPAYFNGAPASFTFRIKKIVYAFIRKVILKISPLPNIEIHNERNRWLYDSVSLKKLYLEAGFVEIKVQDYNTSDIEGWERYNYDKSTAGDYPLEPSLYMEGKKGV